MTDGSEGNCLQSQWEAGVAVLCAISAHRDLNGLIKQQSSLVSAELCPLPAGRGIIVKHLDDVGKNLTGDSGGHLILSPCLLLHDSLLKFKPAVWNFFSASSSLSAATPVATDPPPPVSAVSLHPFTEEGGKCFSLLADS